MKRLTWLQRSWKSYFSSVWNIFTHTIQFLPLFLTVSWKRNKIFRSTASHHFEYHFCRNILRKFRKFNVWIKKNCLWHFWKASYTDFKRKICCEKKAFRIMKRKLIKMALKIAFLPYKCTYSNMHKQTQWIYVYLFCHLPFVTRAL